MSFSTLPFEIRLQILRDVFVFPHSISLQSLYEPSSHWGEPDCRWVWPVLGVSREFRTEGSKILFSANTFNLDIFSKPAGSLDTSWMSKRAHIVSLTRLPHWHVDDTITYNVAIPLPQPGNARIPCPSTKTEEICQDHKNQEAGLGYSAMRIGRAHHYADVEIPRPAWNPCDLIRRIRITAPSSINRLWWEEAELACRMVELLAAKWFPHLVHVELDLAKPLHRYMTWDYYRTPEPLDLLFVVKGVQVEVVGHHRKDLIRALSLRAKDGATIKGGLQPLDDILDFSALQDG